MLPGEDKQGELFEMFAQIKPLAGQWSQSAINVNWPDRWTEDTQRVSRNRVMSKQHIIWNALQAHQSYIYNVIYLYISVRLPRGPESQSRRGGELSQARDPFGHLVAASLAWWLRFELLLRPSDLLAAPKAIPLARPLSGPKVEDSGLWKTADPHSDPDPSLDLVALSIFLSLSLLSDFDLDPAGGRCGFARTAGAQMRSRHRNWIWVGFVQRETWSLADIIFSLYLRDLKVCVRGRDISFVWRPSSKVRASLFQLQLYLLANKARLTWTRPPLRQNFHTSIIITCATHWSSFGRNNVESGPAKRNGFQINVTRIQSKHLAEFAISVSRRR